MNEKPIFKHECDKCIFLGGYTGNNGSYADLYYCLQLGIPTVIARYSDEGDDYVSGLQFASAKGTGFEKPFIAVMREAKRRAIEKGLINETGA